MTGQQRAIDPHSLPEREPLTNKGWGGVGWRKRGRKKRSKRWRGVGERKIRGKRKEKGETILHGFFCCSWLMRCQRESGKSSPALNASSFVGCERWANADRASSSRVCTFCCSADTRDSKVCL